jgi:hypothetical protein
MSAQALASALSLMDLPESYRYISAQPAIAGSQMVSPVRLLPLAPPVGPAQRRMHVGLGFCTLADRLLPSVSHQVTEIMQLPHEQRDVLVVSCGQTRDDWTGLVELG